ncbi:hypothetical protein A2716_03905 [candidate division WWE3 bacterium RIFCSPHIGHO2_01_FULL_40_23]|uniref:Poly A polymerase head domain-containing protein n=1 Tax=candidate division WWE3 bacterium RIFCSPLOWO2_01_FULL_41_18 TaxID=1802625 RepID=A0A1F4VCY4_UNCKA|nr:MAG: hypothetical protein A2716_03905 [candidate division WWE3 bacterium RIFCSPHIGHO2_01_FULL_40_23]OGC55024.1 MAG: hypothetical protein A3A78_03515 [candidate division WWE3 bacterium RIFCSPLOWO2_01_FULL_41_18]
MLTKAQLQSNLNKNPMVLRRLRTLKLAEGINPKFRTPHIVGGYLRNILLGHEPKDCDVVFQGYQLNQPGILEAVREAERRLKIDSYPNWDFENVLATGVTNDFYENTIGRYSHHTDYLTLLLIDTSGTLYLGDNKTLSGLEGRTFDLRFPGVEIWVNHRAKGKSYVYCLIGDLIRGLYLGQLLNLKYSLIAEFLLSYFDVFFKSLSPEDQQTRQAFWMKKTGCDPKYQHILDRFGVKSLKATAS